MFNVYLGTQFFGPYEKLLLSSSYRTSFRPFVYKSVKKAKRVSYRMDFLEISCWEFNKNFRKLKFLI